MLATEVMEHDDMVGLFYLPLSTAAYQELDDL
jgi:hypothetical protein